jgi:hypothetical protein
MVRFKYLAISLSILFIPTLALAQVTPSNPVAGSAPIAGSTFQGFNFSNYASAALKCAGAGAKVAEQINNVVGFDLQCSVSPQNPKVGDKVTWSVKVKNSNVSIGKLRYKWSGDVSGKESTETRTYSSAGRKIATIEVRDQLLKKDTAQCSVTVGAKDPKSPTADSVPVFDKTTAKSVKDAINQLTSVDNRLSEEEKRKIDDDTKVREMREQCLDAVARATAQGMLSQIADRTLNWVNTGFGGNGFYVADQSSYFKSIYNQQLNRYLDNLPQSNGLFGTQVRQTIISQMSGKTPGVISSLPNTEAGRNYDKFLGDFKSGGWSAWLSTTQFSQNNPIGSYLTSIEQINKEDGYNEQNIREELIQGRGYLSARKCVAMNPIRYDSEGRPIGPTTEAERCLEWEVVTPGSLIADQTAAVTTSAIRQLELADEIDETLGLLFDKLLNSLLSEGLDSLGRGNFSGVSYGQYNTGGPGTNAVFNNQGQPIIGASASGAIIPGTSQSGVGAGDFNIKNPRHLRVIIKTQKDYLNKMRDSRVAMRRVVPTLGALDYCLPGPNPTWLPEANNSETVFAGAVEGAVSSAPFITDTYTFDDPIEQDARQFPGRTYTINGVNPLLLSPDDVALEIRSWFLNFGQQISAIYNQDNLIAAYSAATPNPKGAAYAKGFVKDSYAETGNILAYNASIDASLLDYEDREADLEAAITELESIKNEVITIVSAARARHISAMAAAGTPVNMSCLNEAYDVLNPAIVGTPRQESDLPDPLVQESAAAKTYFYLHL